MPKVSVVIPAYNAIAYLPTTIQSVLEQTFLDWELIVVNDGSTDRTIDWVKTLRDPRIRLISQANEGVSAARNLGIHHARGQYIAFLDSDDVWQKTKLEKQVPHLDRDPTIGLVDTGAQWIDHNNYLLDHYHPASVTGTVWPRILESNTLSCGSTALVRRTCFDHLGGFDPAVSPAEDWDMWIRIAMHYPFAAVPETLVYYRQTPSSASKNYQLMAQQLKRVIEKNKQLAKQNYPAFPLSPQRLLLAEKRAYSWVYEYLAWNLFDNGQNFEAFRTLVQAFLSYPAPKWLPRLLRLTAFTLIRSSLGSEILMRFRSSTRRQRTPVGELRQGDFSFVNHLGHPG